MGIRERVAILRYTLRNDAVEILLRLAGRDVRSEIAGAATGSPDVIIDELTGTGAILPLYSRRFPSARIITVDLDPAQLAVVRAGLRRRGLEGVEFLAADARDLPLPAAAADLVSISYGLHELKWLDRELVLGEASRVLRPGGELVVADFREARRLFARMLMGVYMRIFEPRWVRELYGGGLRKQVVDAGFDVREVRTDLPFTQLILAGKPAAGQPIR